MSVLLARYEVSDLDRFVSVFDAFDGMRREHGSTGYRLLRSSREPTWVVVLIDFASPEAAERFRSSQAREAALAEAGVLSRDDEILVDVGPAAAPDPGGHEARILELEEGLEALQREVERVREDVRGLAAAIRSATRAGAP